MARSERTADGFHIPHRPGARAAFPNLVPVHGPIHASWLNQIEIYFSIVERKVLTPNDFRSLEEVENRLLGFQQYYESIAAPLEWNSRVGTSWPR